MPVSRLNPREFFRYLRVIFSGRKSHIFGALHHQFYQNVHNLKIYTRKIEIKLSKKRSNVRKTYFQQNRICKLVITSNMMIQNI